MWERQGQFLISEKSVENSIRQCKEVNSMWIGLSGNMLNSLATLL